MKMQTGTYRLAVPPVRLPTGGNLIIVELGVGCGVPEVLRAGRQFEWCHKVIAAHIRNNSVRLGIETSPTSHEKSAKCIGCVYVHQGPMITAIQMCSVVVQATHESHTHGKVNV